ncbi:MAG: hypothetical protein HUK03_03540, partial [Bacteroidaceae bacterium]|nr:hypothetical protein [Bacteroidaceae bacterium]
CIAFLPTANANAITESGKPLSQAKGVTVLQQEDDEVILLLRQGRYELKVRLYSD